MGKKLVPITREVLKAFYAQHPLDHVPEATLLEHTQVVDGLTAQVLGLLPDSKLPQQLGFETPKRIDDNFWRNREFCEEIADSVSKVQKLSQRYTAVSEACSRVANMALHTERTLFGVQQRNGETAMQQVKQFMPQDFRGNLMDMARQQKEAKYKKAIEDLVRKGGSIRAKYDLYLQHQWERRESLAQLGACSGVYKFLVKYMAGIPQVLLDFAQQINAKLGPMEEQRLAFGPDLYETTSLGNKLVVLAALWAQAWAKLGGSAQMDPQTESLLGEPTAAAIETATAFYSQHMERIMLHIGNIFAISPFFITADQADAGCTSSSTQGQVPGVAAAASMPQLCNSPTVDPAGPQAIKAHSTHVQRYDSTDSAMGLGGPAAAAHSLSPVVHAVPAPPVQQAVALPHQQQPHHLHAQDHHHAHTGRQARLSSADGSGFHSAEEHQDWHEDESLDGCLGLLGSIAHPFSKLSYGHHAAPDQQQVGH